VNANILVDLLLELNVINVKDIDNEINKLAAKLSDPRAQGWFKRVPRYFLVNIDRLLKEPYVAKAEPRPHGSSKYYYSPKGGWMAHGKPESESPKSPLPVREEYDPEKRTYTTALHEPVVQKDIEQSFQKFKPTKAKAKRAFGEPPTKSELQPWMTAAGNDEKELHHFDPIQTRRRELFIRLNNVVNFLNYQAVLSNFYQNNRNKNMATMNREEQVEIINGQEADALLDRLKGMKADDVAGFRDVLKKSADFTVEVKEKPWVFTKDGKTIAQHGEYTLRKTIFPETVKAFSRRAVDAALWRMGNLTPAENGEGYWPTWCTKGSHADTYANQGPLYFADRNDRPYVLAHFESGQVRNPYNSQITAEEARNVAPLFADAQRFPMELLKRGSSELARAVQAYRNGNQGEARLRGVIGQPQPA
jgi:hypothetical protein